MNAYKKLCAVFAAFMTVATIIMLTSCNADGMAQVSERRSGYFVASDAEFEINAVSGVREDPFVADGKVGALVAYTLLTVKPTKFDVDAQYTYTATVGSGAFGGALVVHPFAASFSAEFSAEATTDFTVTVKLGDATREYSLHSIVAADTVTFSEAIAEAKKAVGKIDFDYEIRARLIKNPLEKNGGLCWHIGFYGADATLGALLDPVTAKPLAVKRS